MSSTNPASIRELVDARAHETPAERINLLTDRLYNALWLADCWRSKDPRQRQARLGLDLAKHLLWAEWAGLNARHLAEEWEG